MNNEPLPGVVQGCNESCKVKLKAPALFPTNCTLHHNPINPRGHFNKSGNLSTNTFIAPPFDHDGFFVQPNLLVDERKTINLITGYSESCLGGLHWSICTLKFGIGEYEIEAKNNKIIMHSLSSLTLIALQTTSMSTTLGMTKKTDILPRLAGYWIRSSIDGVLSFFTYLNLLDQLLQKESVRAGCCPSRPLLMTDSHACHLGT